MDINTFTQKVDLRVGSSEAKHQNFSIVGLLAYYIAGFVLFSGVYMVSFDIHWHWYKKDRKRVNMFVYAVRFVRIVHALLATAVSVPVMLYTENLISDRFLILDLFVALSGGYLTFDVLARYNEHLQVYEAPGRWVSWSIVRRYYRKYWQTLLHHFVMVCIVYPLVLFTKNDEGDFILACVLFTEFCTPFIEIQAVLERTSGPLNVKFVVVSMIAISTQFVSRILILPFLYESLADHMGMEIMEFILSLAPWYHAVSICYFVPNLVWFFQNITTTTIYLLTPPNNSAATSNDHQTKGE